MWPWAATVTMRHVLPLGLGGEVIDRPCGVKDCSADAYPATVLYTTQTVPSQQSTVHIV